jgi:hypothetical protein
MLRMRRSIACGSAIGMIVLAGLRKCCTQRAVR